jgi:hypothetical protein
MGTKCDDWTLKGLSDEFVVVVVVVVVVCEVLSCERRFCFP